MKVLLVNTFDKGGAARACLRLSDGLTGIGVENNVLLRKKSVEKPNRFEFNVYVKSSSLIKRICLKVSSRLAFMGVLKQKNDKQKDFINSRGSNLDYFSFPESPFDLTKAEVYKQADIINLHWVGDFLDYPSFFRQNTKPVVWTLHDMNPFSGGEHYTEEYVGVDPTGYPIERTVSEDEQQIFLQVANLKKEALSGVTNLNIVAPSKWLFNEAKTSDLFFKYPVHHIPNGLDQNIFKPRDVNYSRELLGIPIEKKVILFVADSVSTARKGFKFLIDALGKIQNKDVVLVAVGANDQDLPMLENLIALGPISDERLMSAVYSATDVFVIPSLMDNLPNTVLESLMCGTPVIGFPIGGIVDMVEHKCNGLLASEISSSALASSIQEFIDNPSIFEPKEIRREAIKKYSLEIQANAYKALFEKVLDS